MLYAYWNGKKHIFSLSSFHKIPKTFFFKQNTENFIFKSNSYLKQNMLIQFLENIRYSRNHKQSLALDKTHE